MKLYQLNNNILQEVQNSSSLGLEIYNDLKWSPHINNICQKANATMGFLRRKLTNVPESYRKTAYISLVRSIMEYEATIWNPYQTVTLTNWKKFITGQALLRASRSPYRSKPINPALSLSVL